MSAVDKALVSGKTSVLLGPFDDVMTAATVAAAINDTWADAPVDVHPRLVLPQEITLLSDPLNILNVLPKLREEFAQNRPFIEAFDLIESRIKDPSVPADGEDVSPTVDTGL